MKYIFVVLAGLACLALTENAKAQFEFPEIPLDPAHIRLAPQAAEVDTINVWGGIEPTGRVIIPRGISLAQYFTLSGIAPALGVGTQGGIGNIGTSRSGGLNTGGGIIRYFYRPQVDVYLMERNEMGEETVTRFRYRARKPFESYMRDFTLESDMYLYIQPRYRPTFWEIFVFTVSATTTFLGAYFLYQSVFR